MDSKMDDPDMAESPDTPAPMSLVDERHDGIPRDRRVDGISDHRDTSAGSERTVVESAADERNKST